jgi:predicted alpha/beta superfamily hydrolase
MMVHARSRAFWTSSFALLLSLALWFDHAVAAENELADSPVRLGDEYWVRSEVFQQQRRVQVYLPSSYGTSQARYPVLYLLDGDVYYVSVAGTVRMLSESSGRIPEMIVVSIPNVAREHELGPALRKPKPDEEPYVADRFLRFLKQDLIPWVDARYRTQPFRLLVGHSRTGLFTLYTFLNSPDTFNAYLALSPALWWDDEALLQEAPAKLRTLKPGKATRFLYLAAGHESVEITEPTGRMARLLEQTRLPGLRWRYDYLANENHMSSHLPGTIAGLQMVFADLQVPDATLLSQGLAGVESRYAGLQRVYGFELRPSHAMLSWMGSFLIQQGREEEAAAFFRRAEQLYPNHPPLMRDWPARPLQ